MKQINEISALKETIVSKLDNVYSEKKLDKIYPEKNNTLVMVYPKNFIEVTTAFVDPRTIHLEKPNIIYNINDTAKWNIDGYTDFVIELLTKDIIDSIENSEINIVDLYNIARSYFENKNYKLTDIDYASNRMLNLMTKKEFGCIYRKENFYKYYLTTDNDNKLYMTVDNSPLILGYDIVYWREYSAEKSLIDEYMTGGIDNKNAVLHFWFEEENKPLLVEY